MIARLPYDVTVQSSRVSVQRVPPMCARTDGISMSRVAASAREVEPFEITMRFYRQIARANR